MLQRMSGCYRFCARLPSKIQFIVLIAHDHEQWRTSLDRPIYRLQADVANVPSKMLIEDSFYYINEFGTALSRQLQSMLLILSIT